MVVEGLSDFAQQRVVALKDVQSLEAVFAHVLEGAVRQAGRRPVEVALSREVRVHAERLAVPRGRGCVGDVEAHGDGGVVDATHPGLVGVQRVPLHLPHHLF